MCDKVNLQYLPNHFDKLENILNVLEVGSYDINGNWKKFIEKKGLEYLGIDVKSGPGVDKVCDITDDIKIINKKLGYKQFDLIICMNVLEHLYEPIKALNNMRDLLRTGGYLVIATPIVWDLHEWPHDFYRLNPDFYKKYMEDNKFKILDDTFLFSVRQTKKFYSDTNILPEINRHIYKKRLVRVIVKFIAKFVPELRHCWTHMHLNLICQKENS
ncbi:MAG: class I SAM-dependent methyltransferase [Candidatus Omnitrophota bacterium]